MKHSSRDSSRLFVDLIGILFLASTAAVFYTDSWRILYWRIVPRLPVLSNLEWEDSKMTALHTLSLDDGYEYKVELRRSYLNGSENTWVYVDQTTTWYSSSEDALNAWQNPEDQIYKGVYIEFSSELLVNDKDKASFLDEFHVVPVHTEIASSLKCHDWDEGQRSCVYFGHHQHWFTQIWFRSKDKTLLTNELMVELIEKAVHIILDAPLPGQ